MRFTSTFFVALLTIASSLLAQPLADRVPNDAIVYIGWHGAGTMPAEYANSHLKAILDNSKARELFTEFVPQLLAKLAARQPQTVGPINVARELLNQVWDHPTAFYFSGLEIMNGQPLPKLALICQAGADAPAMREQIAGLLQRAGNSPLRVDAVGDVVVIYVGFPQASQALTAAQGASLLQAPAFTSAMKQVGNEPMVLSYVDVEKLLATFENLAKQNPNPQVAAKASQVIDVLGLRGLKRVVCAAGFDGQDWMSQEFIEAPSPRAGLLDLLDGKPISADLLKAIPADATFAATGRFDAAKFILRVRELSGQVDPQGTRYVDMAIGAVQIALARNPVTDILEPLGEDWGIYSSPSVGGSGALGVVAVNHLDDPAKARSALPTASVNLSNWAGIALARARAQVQISGQMTEIGDQKVYYVGLPIVAPAWTIKDNYLYLGPYPQLVATAARVGAAGGKSITENPKFIALQNRLKVANPCSFSFYDLPASATQGGIYAQYLMLARYAGFADLMLGVPMPEPLMPPLDVLVKHLTPAGSFAWIDDAGYHVKSVGPFPGSKMLSEQGVFSVAGVGGAAMGASILLPSLNRARETANRVKCAANMKSIGIALLLYANENRGKYPPNLGELILKEDITADSFICPSSGSSIPPAVRAGNPNAIAEWVSANSDYVYLGAGTTSAMGPEDVVLYDKPGHHDNDGINILFGDGHVEFVLMNRAMQMITQQAPAGGL